MALYRPSVDGEENERLADVAIQAFENYQRTYPNDPKIEEYLVTVLINAERYEQALERLERKARSGDAALEQAIVTIMVRAGRYPTPSSAPTGPVPARILNCSTRSASPLGPILRRSTLDLVERSADVELGSTPYERRSP